MPLTEAQLNQINQESKDRERALHDRLDKKFIGAYLMDGNFVSINLDAIEYVTNSNITPRLHPGCSEDASDECHFSVHLRSGAVLICRDDGAQTILGYLVPL